MYTKTKTNRVRQNDKLRIWLTVGLKQFVLRVVPEERGVMGVIKMKELIQWSMNVLSTVKRSVHFIMRLLCL